eukprot:TRINITY_DN38492_c0_g1_i1.p2 TRINITY_DN38492_c0_g1~~TRINITY_DN38492_c0_g1_i1.p2  ORF type:complete len:301 (+),score=42.38 TRINITY_DN38492_c0_g1_i1:477-1379(+)
MPNGHGSLRGQRVQSGTQAHGSSCSELRHPQAPELRMRYCPSHRRAEVALFDPARPGVPVTVLATRCAAGPEITQDRVGISTYFSKPFVDEWAALVRAAAQRGHRVVVVMQSGAHDVAGGPTRPQPEPLAVDAWAKWVLRYRGFVERLVPSVAALQTAGAHVIWRANNHGATFPARDKAFRHDYTRTSPVSQEYLLRRLDTHAKEVFSRALEPLGSRFLNITEVTRVFWGDVGGWAPRPLGWWRADVRNRRPLPFRDGLHCGAIGRYWVDSSPVEVSALISQALLSAVRHGCAPERTTPP